MNSTSCIQLNDLHSVMEGDDEWKNDVQDITEEIKELAVWVVNDFSFFDEKKGTSSSDNRSSRVKPQDSISFSQDDAMKINSSHSTRKSSGGGGNRHIQGGSGSRSGSGSGEEKSSMDNNTYHGNGYGASSNSLWRCASDCTVPGTESKQPSSFEQSYSSHKTVQTKLVRGLSGLKVGKSKQHAGIYRPDVIIIHPHKERRTKKKKRIFKSGSSRKSGCDMSADLSTISGSELTRMNRLKFWK